MVFEIAPKYYILDFEERHRCLNYLRDVVTIQM